jgi:hypothetical protein
MIRLGNYIYHGLIDIWKEILFTNIATLIITDPETWACEHNRHFDHISTSLHSQSKSSRDHLVVADCSEMGYLDSSAPA